MGSQKWADVLASGTAEFPKLSVRPFDDAWFFRTVQKLGWNMGGITLYNVVYMDPDEIDTDAGSVTLLHELVHVRDQHKWNLLFLLSYFFLPIGFSFKAIWEWRAYKASLKGYYDLYQHYKQTDPAYYDYIMDYECNFVARQFCSASYLWMWPFRSAMYKKAKDYVASLS